VSDRGQGRHFGGGGESPQPFMWAGSLAALVKITSSGTTDLLSDYAIFIEYIYFTNMAAGRGLDISEMGEAGRGTRRFVRVTNKEEGR